MIFLKSKKFYLNLIAIIALSVAIIFGALKAIEVFTRHGEKIAIPDFTGQHYNELSENPEFKRFRFSIMDSVYDVTKEKGSIIEQDPKPESFVKSGRTIYLTVVSQNPEMVEMPELRDLTLRNAKSLLQSYGLKVDDISYVPDIAKNAVVDQKFRGRPIEEGTKIQKGSSIHLVLGLGTNKELVAVPMLIGMKRSEAIEELHIASLNLGKEFFDDNADTSKLRIYNQKPFFSNKTILKYGDAVDVWYKSEDNFDFEHYLQNLDTANMRNLNADSLQ